MSEQHDRVVLAAAELHPPGDPRIQLTPLRDKSRLPVTRRRRHHAPPGCARLPSATRRGGVAPPPNSEQSELEALTPATRDLVPETATLLIARPPTAVPCPVPDRLRGSPRLASLRPRHEDELPTQAQPARHSVLNGLDDERVHSASAHSPLGATAPKSRTSRWPLSRTRSHYLTLSTGGRPHQRRCHVSLPKYGQPRRYRVLIGAASAKITENPSGESFDVSGASHRRGGLRRDRARAPLSKSNRQSRANAAASSCSSRPRLRRRRRPPRSYLTNAQSSVAGHGIDPSEGPGMAISARLADDERSARDVP